MTPEKDFHYTLIQYLDYKSRPELSNIIKHSRIVYDKQWGFTGVVSDQRKLHINIKTPLIYKSILEKELDFVRGLCFEIYEDDDDYMATSVGVSIMAARVTTVEINQIDQEIIENSVYQAFVREVSQMNLDPIEESYLFEACECAMRNNRLAASTMLGCAAEYLLLNVTEAFKIYLGSHVSEKEVDNYEKKVIRAKCAYNRLDEFSKRVESNADLFQSLGFENPKLNFNFLDIIRKVRNEAGHPSGNNITAEELQMTFGNYQHFLKRAHKLIRELPMV
jgi:hypothetical protein